MYKFARVLIWALSTIFLLEFRTVLLVWQFCFVFILLLFCNNSDDASFTDIAKLRLENICYIVASGQIMVILCFMGHVLQIVVCSFVLFLLTIVLSVLLRFTDSEYPFGIFKLFLKSNQTEGLLFFKEVIFICVQSFLILLYLF